MTAMSGNETMVGVIADLVALRGGIVNANVTATEIRTEDVTAR